MTVLGHFSAAYIGYAAQQGVPAAGFLVPLSGVIATLGGLSVTFGYKAKLGAWLLDRKSTRLNSSHGYISYAVFCLKKKKKKQEQPICMIAAKTVEKRP